MTLYNIAMNRVMEEIANGREYAGEILEDMVEEKAMEMLDDILSKTMDEVGCPHWYGVYLFHFDKIFEKVEKMGINTDDWLFCIWEGQLDEEARELAREF